MDKMSLGILNLREIAKTFGMLVSPGRMFELEADRFDRQTGVRT